VSAAKWISDGTQIEVTLDGIEARYFVAPLKQVLETQRQDQINVGDTALLIGQYLVVASPAEGVHDGQAEFYMENWLRIVNSEVQVTAVRGRNRRAPEQTNVVSRFR